MSAKIEPGVTAEVKFRKLTVWIALILILSAAAARADEPMRGLVVDRGSGALWLGLPGPVPIGTGFNVYLAPGGEPMAFATVIDITPDAPYVAKAKMRALRPDAFIPVGAYVEAAATEIPEADKHEGGFQDMSLTRRYDRRLTFRAGALFPTNGDLKDETDNLWPAFQASYRLCDSPERDLQVGLGYFGGSGTFTGGSRDFRVLPVTLDARFRTSAGSGLFARAGIGAYYIRDERTLGLVTTSNDMVTFGWQAGFGYTSAGGYSAEICYTDVLRTDFGGVVLSLGTQF